MKLICSLLFFTTINMSIGITQNFIPYYQLTNRAEIAICDSLYENAIEYYDSAFGIVQRPFHKDLKNANICALKTKNYKKSFKYIQHLLEVGYSLDCFYTSDYDSLKSTIFWKKLKSNDNMAKSMKNEDLFEELKKRSNKEQGLAHQRDIDTIYYKKYVDCVVDNYEYIRQITKNYGFPDEDFNENDLGKNKSYIYFTLLHYYQLINIQSRLPNDRLKHLTFLLNYKFNYTEIQALLKNAVLAGKFLPSTFANFEDIVKSDKYGTLNFIQVDDTCGFVSYSELEEINKNRSQIGLCSLANSETFIKYKLKFNSECPYPPNDNVEVSVCKSEEKQKEEFDLRSGKYQVYYFVKHEEGRAFFESIVNK